MKLSFPRAFALLATLVLTGIAAVSSAQSAAEEWQVPQKSTVVIPSQRAGNIVGTWRFALTTDPQDRMVSVFHKDGTLTAHVDTPHRDGYVRMHLSGTYHVTGSRIAWTWTKMAATGTTRKTRILAKTVKAGSLLESMSETITWISPDEFTATDDNGKATRFVRMSK